MTSKRSIIIFVLLIILLWSVIAVSIHHIFHGLMIGIDYMFYWHAGRVFFFEQGDIYSTAVGDQNQMWVYGRPAQPGEDDLNFAYPPYILFLPAPFFLLSYDWSQALWMATNLLLLIGMGLFFFPHAPKWIPFTFLLFYPIYFTLIIGNTALLIGLLLIVITNELFFKKKYSPSIHFLLGVFLALATGKPQMVWFFIVLIFFYCIVYKYWSLIYGFVLSFAALNVASFAMYPSWPIHWIRNTMAYSSEGGIAPTLVWYLKAWVPESTAVGLYAAFFILFIPISIYLFLRWKNGRFDSLCLIGYVAFVTNLFDPSSLTPDKIVLLVPLFLWAVHNYSSRVVKIVWTTSILLTNTFFVIGLVTPFKLSTDMLPLLLFIPWLIYIIISRQNTQLPLALQPAE